MRHASEIVWLTPQELDDYKREDLIARELKENQKVLRRDVPSRKPTVKDIADIKEHKDDLIEPQDYESMDDMVKDL